MQLWLSQIQPNLAQLILLKWRNILKIGWVLKYFVQELLSPKKNVYAATVEQAKPLPKIMNQHDQRGMQSSKLKDIGKDLENSSSQKLLRYNLWYFKKDIHIWCRFKIIHRKWVPKRKGKLNIDTYMYREKYLKIFFSRITTLHFMIVILLFKHAHIIMYSWFFLIVSHTSSWAQCFR